MSSEVAAHGVTRRSPRGASRLAFRPVSRRRSRLATGVVLGALAVAGNVLAYSSLDDRHAVLQAVRDVPAGALVTEADLVAVAVDVGSSVRTVPAEHLAATLGRYARVRIGAGSLLVQEALQDGPLVSPGAAVVAVQVAEGAVPIGVRERSRVDLVVPVDDARPVVVPGRTVGVPGDAVSITGMVSLSVEVAIGDAPLVAAAERVAVILLEPGTAGPEGGS